MVKVLVEHAAELNLDMQVLGQDISESPMQNTNSNKGKEWSQRHVQSSDSKIKKVFILENSFSFFFFILWIPFL